jgi:putative peptidoglycan lipid II flippase
MFNRQVGADNGDRTNAVRFAEDALAVLLPVLVIFTAVMIIGAVPIVWALTGGFPGANAEKFALTVDFTRLTFPYLALISLVSLMGGILNSVGRFSVNAAAPILLNVALIIGLLGFNSTDDVTTARVQALCVTIGGILQFAWLLWACITSGFELRLRLPRLGPQVRTLLRLILPAALGAGAVQFNLLVSTALAARFLPEGAVSFLYYADRLNQLPLGLIGIGVGTAMLPALSRQLGAGNAVAAVHTQNRAIELVLLLTLPAAAALTVSAAPIIRALLEHGRFLPADTLATANALAAFSLGLPAYVLIKVLTPGFHARQDTSTPVRIAIAAMLVNLVGNLILIWPLAHVGIALATALSAWVNAAALFIVLRRRGHFAIDARLRRSTLRLLLATLVMIGVLLLINPLVAPFTGGSWLVRIAALSVLIGGGAIAYLVAARLLGIFTLAELRAQFSRKGSAT